MTILHLYKDYNQDSGFAELKSRLDSFYQNVVVENLSEVEAFSNVQLVHAHSWYDDGITAYNLKRERGIPYVLTLCEKDLAQLQKFSLRSKRFEVLEQAEKVVFQNPMSQNVLTEKMSQKMADAVFSHSWVIYKGLTPFWFNNLRLANPVSLIRIRLLTVENPTLKDSVEEIRKAVKVLLKRNFVVELTTFRETDTSEAQRMELYRNHDILVAPSLSGQSTMLFAEALSQGLPVLYGKGGCFDGIFSDGLSGYSVTPHNTMELADKILLVSERYATMEQHISDLHPLHLFNYDEIYRQYLRIYDCGLC